MNNLRTYFRLICLFTATILTVKANPTGGQTAAGSASIAGEGTSAVTIKQASNLAVINWQTFSINSGESTSFLQPSASSAALNRVLGGQTSLINGTLSANGQIYLVNGNGIVVGPGGVISANAFTASTRNISDSDFLAGNLHFSGSDDADVQNFGKITALGGDVVLIGKTVDNEGTIHARKGTVGLVAGDDVLLAQKNADGSTITVSPDSLATSASSQVGVKNGGKISAAAAELKAANGNVYALAIQNSGIIRATTVQKQGGHIWLTSDSGTIVNSGKLDASAKSPVGSGGTVTLKNMAGATIHTGLISATGGVQGGNGGTVEISGANVGLGGSVDVSAPHGTTGNILLDPEDLTISATSGGLPSITAGAGNPSIPFSQGGTTSGDDYYVSPAQLAALNGNVDLQAARDLTVNSSFTNSAGSITLEAGRNLTVNASLTSSTEDITLIAASTSSPTLYPNGVLSIQSALSANNVTLDAPMLDLNAGITHTGTLSGTATTVNVGANGLVQNAIDASSTTSAPTINLAAATYTLSSEILINKSLTLNGDTTSGSILNANNASRVMEIDGTVAGTTVNLNNLTLENGNSDGVQFSDAGGALAIVANTDKTTVTINDSTFLDNIGSNVAGAIWNYATTVGAADGSATLTITNSTFTDNSAKAYAGAIYNEALAKSSTATLTIRNSTITGNSVTDDGGAIYNLTGGGAAVVTISNSTITGNSAGKIGGGLYNDALFGSPSMTISDSILAGNTVNGVESDFTNNGGSLTDNGYNLFGNDGNLTTTATGDVMVAAIGNSGDISSVLAGTESGSGSTLVFTPTLANNGGPTQTIALVVGSPAYLAGGTNSGGQLDQRGDTRGSTISIGAWDYNPSQFNASSLVVNTNADTVDVIGSTPVTLRDAIFYAEKGSFTSPTITFDSSAFTGGAADTITLNGSELLINNSLNIDASAVGGVTISGNNASRVMEIDGTASGDTVNLSNLTLENGNGNGANLSGNGGGLLVYAAGSTTATVTIANSMITGNSTSGSTVSAGGIQIESSGGSVMLTINDSTISNNTAATVGGGISNYSNGGNAALVINDSTISDNSSGNQGGGIFNFPRLGNATVTISNSTISGNSTDIFGGGIYLNGGTVTISNSTISSNSANGAGGGVAGSDGTLIMGDTILAGNTAMGGYPDYYNISASRLTDEGHNLVATGGGTFLTNGVNGDIVTSDSIGAILAPLGDYGGPTQTMALVVGSPAYLAGGPVGSVTTDQRGDTRGSTISIGAWDYNPSQFTASSLVVDTNADTVDVIGSTPVSLRDAIYYAQEGSFTSPTITFNSSAFTGGAASTITLIGSELLINSSLSIDASAVNGVTISGNNASRVMEIDGTVAGDTINLSNLTLENGATGFGAGLYISSEGKEANVSVTNSAISANSASTAGGGIYSDGSNSGNVTLTITGSTISGNSAPSGGGIISVGEIGGNATLTVTKSTLTGNSSTTLAGAIGTAATASGPQKGFVTVTITDSTITGNTDATVGGIYISSDSAGSQLTISNTILAANTAGGAESDLDASGVTVTDNGYNLYGQNGNDGGFNSTHGVTVAGTDIKLSGAISTVLAPLANNGGPTETMALVVGSPAIDAGNPALIGTADQRGILRGTPLSGTGSAADIGAYEAAIIDVTADDQEIIYGQTPTLTYTASGPTGASGLLNGTLALTTPETNVGTYTGDIGQGTLASTGNIYLVDFTAGTLKIDQRTVTIDPTAGQSKIYGTVDPTLTYSTDAATGTTGLVNGDTLTGNISYDSAGQYTNAGNYATNLGTLANGNYNIVLETSAPTFAITQRTVTIDPTAGQSKVYGTVDPTLVYTTETATSTTGLVNGDTLSDDISYDSAGQYTNVGNYATNLGTLANGNYNIVLQTSAPSFGITPATLTYEANPATRNVGQANPVFTGTVTGFVDSQTVVSATTETLSFTSPATASSSSGSYAIDGSGLTANFGNYVFVQAPGNATALTIGGFPVGQPGEPFFNFSAQFNANANFNSFFTQSQFWLFDPDLNGWLVPVFTPGNVPHKIYWNKPPGYSGDDKPPKKVILFGSSYLFFGDVGGH